jgi:hypothetical protein
MKSSRYNNNKKHHKQLVDEISNRRWRRIGVTATNQEALLIMDAKDGIPLGSNCVDTVLTNPSFGTKNNQGIDV